MTRFVSKTALTVGIAATVMVCTYVHTYAAKPKCLKSTDCINYYDKGKSAFKDENYEKAIPYFQITLDEDETFTPAMIYLGICFCKTGKQTEAQDYFNKVKNILPMSEDAQVAVEWLKSPDCQPPKEPEKEEGVLPRPKSPDDVTTSIVKKEGAPTENTNLCLNKKVTDLWSPYATSKGWEGWQNKETLQSVVDDNFSTAVTAGYGKWGRESVSKQIQLALEEASRNGTGIPGLRIDLEVDSNIKKIIIGRPPQHQDEGSGGAKMVMSIWASQNAEDWTVLIDPFHIPPGESKEFKIDIFKTDKSFRYLQINLNSMGFYKWKNNNDSQIGISEIQCFENAGTDKNVVPKENKNEEKQ